MQGEKHVLLEECYCLRLITRDTKYYHRFQKIPFICALFAQQLLPKWIKKRQKTRENCVLRTTEETSLDF